MILNSIEERTKNILPICFKYYKNQRRGRCRGTGQVAQKPSPVTDQRAEGMKREAVWWRNYICLSIFDNDYPFSSTPYVTVSSDPNSFCGQ